MIARCLILLAFGVLLIENTIRVFPDTSLGWVVFALTGLYVAVTKPGDLVAVLMHPVFLWGLGLVAFAMLAENAHGASDFEYTWRVLQMLIGGALIGVLCSNGPALRTAALGYAITGVGVALLAVMVAYTVAAGAEASSYGEASRIRTAAFADYPLVINLNRMAVLAAQGALAALAFGLTSRRGGWRTFWLGTATLCLLGAFLTFSRGGIAIGVLSVATLLWFHFREKYKAALIGAAIVGLVVLLAPDAVLARLHIGGGEANVEDSRTRIYGAVAKSFPEYWAFGVGAGRFEESWGVRHGFESGNNVGPNVDVVDAHNSFMQVTLFWGVVGLALLIGMSWSVYRCIRSTAGRTAAYPLLCSLGVSLFLFMMVSHNLYAKEVALGLGVIVGAYRSIQVKREVRESIDEGYEARPTATA